MTMSLFDAPAVRTTDPGSSPRARRTDAEPAHQAAETFKPGNAECVRAIRRFVAEYGPCTAFEVADALEGRWAHDSIRSACSRSGLMTMKGGLTPRGNACQLYFLPTMGVSPVGGLL